MKIKNLLFLMVCIHTSYSHGMSNLPSPVRSRKIYQQRREGLGFAALQLFTAVRSGEIQQIENALSLPFANINYRYACSKLHNYTVLLFATEVNNVTMCEFLLKNGAHINIKALRLIGNEWNVVSPIGVAITNNFQELVKLFITYKVHLNKCEYINFTPLHHAAFNNRSTLIKMFIAAGADVDNRDWNGLTPLHIATQDDYQKVMRTLLQENADPNARDREGNTPLHYAAIKNALESVCELISYNADISIANNENYLPYELISDCDAHDQLLKLLRPTQ